jgi:hypothetical protein
MASVLDSREAPAPGAPGGDPAGGLRALFGRRFRRLSQATIVGFSPGVLAGIYIAGLLFFLNPHWPFEAGPVIRAVVRYATLLGLASALLVTPVVMRRPRLLRWWPWGLVVALAGAGTLYWVQAAHYSLFLPTGINRRLLKAAIGLSIDAVVGFYALVVPALRRRPTDWRSRALLGALVVITVYFVFERREAFRPQRAMTPRPSRVTQPEKPHLVLVGVPSATLDVVLPLAEQGQLPFLADALREGAYARVTTLTPTDPVATWASLMTGRLPSEHGLLGHHRFPADFIAPGMDFKLLPVGVLFSRWGLAGGALPTLHDAARALSILEITQRLGVGTAVIGWPQPLAPMRSEPGASSVAIPTEGAATSVSATIEGLAARLDPPALRSVADDLRFASQATQELDARSDPSAVFLYLPGLEAVAARTYGHFAQVALSASSKPATIEGARVLSGYYARLDQALERLWESTPTPRLLVVVSAYGIEATATAPWVLTTTKATTRGAPDGLLIVRGDGVRAAGLVPRVSILDVVPTLLYSLGFPAARDLAGRTLTEIFEPGLLELRPLTFVPSYETALPYVALPDTSSGEGLEPQRR